MSEVDTSAEAVERDTRLLLGLSVAAIERVHVADRLRALLRERDEARAALSKCVIMLDALRSESGRDLPWGAEDCFRRGEWFDEEDVAIIEAARAILAKAESRT